jgi:hypothetical protein
MNVPRSFAAVCDLAISLGVTRINKLPGCWEHQVDEHWWVAVNGHDKPTLCSTETSVPPFSIYVVFNGWPAGIIDAGGGCLAAGALANEETFLAAIQNAKKAVA